MRRKAIKDANSSGCYLNPDPETVKDLIGGLKYNEDRYGYTSCPCRLASGLFEHDRDILCPCDYRDIDVLEYGACYCTLYVRQDVFERKTPLPQVPERRPQQKQERAYEVPIMQPKEHSTSQGTIPKDTQTIQLRYWYCKQCGYICYREDSPYVCPICKANQKLFAEIMPFQ
jgi:ferredoxin-thioredoxin reductase catalytic subunit